jgi:chemotaxis protein methyltransferase CheR
MPIEISSTDFDLMKTFIEQQCGIVLRDSQNYLLESRLNGLLAQNQCRTFGEFYRLARQNRIPGLREKIINAMTTNETFWFRDSHPWQEFMNVILPEWNAAQKPSSPPRRIWSAAASMGQEAYSISMLIDSYNKNHPDTELKNRIEILGTDISTSALFVAISGNYDEMAMGRGFIPPFEQFRQTYFVRKNRVWEISEDIRKMVKFQHFNLQDSFITLGKFDLICLRNVIIYFSNDFKETLFDKIANCLAPGGYLLLGASETPIRYTNRLKLTKVGQSIYYQVKE